MNPLLIAAATPNEPLELGLYLDPPRGNVEVFSGRTVSQSKRRLLNRRSGLSRGRRAKNYYPLYKQGRSFPKNKTLASIQLERLDRKNARRKINGLPPIKDYSQI